MKNFSFILVILISISLTTDGYSCCNTKFCKLFKTTVFKLNNDVIKRRKDPSSDKRYTNGLAFGYISTDIKKYSKIFNNCPFIDKFGDKVYTSIHLNHDIYTPDEIEDTIPQEDQHPYSGELNFTFGLHGNNSYKLLGHNTPTLLSLSLGLGATGKYSLAKNIQTGFHGLTENDLPLGWDNQLPSHFVGKLSGSIISKCDPITIKDTSVEVLVNIGGDVGNTLRQGTAGIELRIGWNIPNDYGTYALDSGSFVSNLQNENSLIYDTTRYGLHMLLYARGKYVDYNYHIGEIVSPTREIAELGIGFGLSLHKYKFTIMYITQSEQFEEQNGPHKFGSFTLTYAR